MYGVSVAGLGDAQLEHQRASTGAALSWPVKGRSRSSQFLLVEVGKLDPMFLANSLPLQLWVRAVFESWASDAQMPRAFDYAVKIRNQGWRTVLGPAGA
eukprot:4407227-Pyramimonas_sp.AAC.1